MPKIDVQRLDDNEVDSIKRHISRNIRSLEGEARHNLDCASDNDMAAKRAAFLQAAKRLRQRTRGRKQTPAEALILEDRDNGHGDNF